MGLPLYHSLYRVFIIYSPVHHTLILCEKKEIVQLVDSELISNLAELILMQCTIGIRYWDPKVKAWMNP